MKRFLPLILLGTLSAVMACGQTTQGLISGRIVDSQTGAGISGAEVSYLSAATNTSGSARSDSSGYYVLPLLPPGQYQIRVADDRYQAQELQVLELPVAARIDLNFRLRPRSDVWEAGQYRSLFLPNSESVVTFYGPDVDTSHFGSFEATRGRRGALESSVSQVIDPVQVRDLPLAGRDVYTMLVTQPGVTADTTTARGLGLSINGMRPSSSNFMLDGLENNNYLVTGPLTAIAPEAVQEYRVSTNNFSAEYGRTAGFLANAVTHSGGSRWHGIGYYYLKNEAVNANGFQENRKGLPRLPAKENQWGFRVGGPVRARSLFASSAFEHLRSRGRGEPVDLALPSTRFSDFTAPESIAGQLLRRFPAPAVTDSFLPTANLHVAPPASVDRSLALERVDYQPGRGAHRLMGRLAVARLGRPDFIWTPYPDFVSGLEQNTYSVAATAVSSLKPTLTNELRVSGSWDDLHWNRPHPEIPTLFSGDGVILPGSLAFYEYRNRSRSTELVENLLWAQGRHIFKAGGGFLLRRLDGFLTAGRDGLYAFSNIIDFALDDPRSFSVSVSRDDLSNFRVPDFNREYSYDQYFFFAQDTFKAAPRLVLNYGVRYENFGAPRNSGAVKDGAVELGPAADFAGRLTAARLVFANKGDQSILNADNNDWGLRFGFSYDPLGAGRTLVRGAYGIFYDRPFDNLWENQRNNNVVLSSFTLPAGSQFNYLASIPAALRGFQGRRPGTDFPSLTFFQPNLRDAYVQSYFFGMQHQLSGAWTLEIDTLGSLGRKLITTDSVNRPLSRPIDFGTNPDGRLNPSLPPISYRANQGVSNYNALTLVTRYRTPAGQFQLAYTWSHSIDNQSEPLARDFFDLNFTRITAGAGRNAIAAFSRQFDSRVDRGNADFDQRHNLVFFSIWDLPAARQSFKARWLLRDWKFSQLAAFRSGFPYTVNAVSVFAPGGALIINNRADFIRPTDHPATPADGGQRLLDSSAFQAPAPGRLGNLGRNAFQGPGLFNIDVSLSRSFPLPRLGEAGRVTLRADAFNFLNHANLNNPDSFLTSPTFGVALYGRRGRESGFPALTPLNETARQFQLILRLEF